MVARYPDNELARFSLGRALFDSGEYAGAREHLSAALARKPDWMAVQILVGKCDLELGDPVAARAAFERARDLALAQHHEGPLAEMEDLLDGLHP
jgi:Flp pilus assembly protein TadD